MKLKKIFIILFLVVIGCKDGAKNQTNEPDKQEVIANVFIVKLNVIVEKNDNFCLLYTEDGSLNFAKGVWKGVTGLENEQTVEISLPENVFPTQLRLDFGMNKEQEDIILKSVKLEYNGKTRVFIGPEVGSFFRADESKCSYDPATGVIKAVVKNGERQFPSLYPQEKVLGPELEKMM